ncbi:Nitronate monooxygenase [Apiospora marii]|uniref:Nitronate monooxygenase n=1 Tax=Apiospora marii TaxID=335849 RepID=UPI00313151BE
MATENPLHKWFPATARPLIISAPMFTVANGALAAAVTKAGGLGMVPAGMDPTAASPHLAALDEQLTMASQMLHDGTSIKSASETADDVAPPLQVGVGFLTLLATPEAYRANALPILRRHRPAFVWLFGSDPAEYGPLIALFRDAGAGWGIKVFVQVGTVEAARQVVRAGADVVVAQGSDAGGHQFAAAASVVALVPEIVDALRNEAEFRDREVGMVAAGGVVDGRGVAAALALGADAVAMGTRFMACPEADSNSFVRNAILNTNDGGATTVRYVCSTDPATRPSPLIKQKLNMIRSPLNDAIMGYPTWSKLYAGRTVIHSGLQDIEHGIPIEQVHESFKKAMAEGDETRMITFSGAGVGLVRSSKPAGEVVQDVRAEALAVIAKLKGNI